MVNTSGILVRAKHNGSRIICIDPRFTETAQLADVILPASAWPEKDGTATNTNRQVQMGRAAVPLPGDARPDWWIIQEIARRIGCDWNYPHPREVFAPAVRDSTAAIISIHNHPSGDPAPSREDRECTQRLIRAGQILGIRVLDHIILGHDDYFSFADAGLLNAE